MLSLKSLNPNILLKALFWTILSLKTLESVVLFQHVDALSYHLVFGRLVNEYGFQYAHTQFYLSSLTGIFDYLYILPNLIFGHGMFAQLSAQFLHFCFGTLSTILLFHLVFKKRNIFYLASLSLLTFDRSPDFLLYAKNDGVLAFVFLLGTLLIFNQIHFNGKWLKYRPYLTGMAIGLLPMIKMTGLIYGGVLFIATIIKKRRNLPALLKVALSAICVSAPIFIRNWIIIGNPIFPAFLELFPTKISVEMKDFMNSLLKTSGENISAIARHYLVAFSPKAIGFLSIPLAYYNFKNKNHLQNSMLLLLISFTSLYCVINSGYVADRFYFGCHFLLIFYIFSTLEKIPRAKTISYVMILLTLSDSKIDKLTSRVVTYYSDVIKLGVSKELQHKYIPFTKIWDFVNENEKVLSSDVPMSYYAPKGVRLYQAGHSHEGGFFYKCKKENISKYKQFDLFFLKKRKTNPCIDAIKKNETYAGKSGPWLVYRNSSKNELTQ